MKKTYFLYGIVILAIVTFVICFIGYATDILPMHTQKQTSETTASRLRKKKNCDCCTEGIRELRMKFQKAREARQIQESEQVKR